MRMESGARKAERMIMMMEQKLISQRNTFSENFGSVLRSSAIFYYKYSSKFKTTLSFMNYWLTKRNLDVTVIASLREMNGKLLRREPISFGQGTVVNYRPLLNDRPFFEGSIEIEVFSNKNLFIPYAAVMAIYESQKGISMVHSYSRTYYPHEIEEDRIITKGEESCWTLRDTNKSRSFCVLHNGGNSQKA